MPQRGIQTHKARGLLITTVPLENMRISLKGALALPKENGGNKGSTSIVFLERNGVESWKRPVSA